MPPVQTDEDEWLVVRCQLGERPAFDELISPWGEPVWKYVRRLTNSDEVANEIVQDVWLRVLRGLHRLRDGSKLRAWLFAIARRTLMDRLREHYAAPVMSQSMSAISRSQMTAMGQPTTSKRTWPRCKRPWRGCQSSNARR